MAHRPAGAAPTAPQTRGGYCFAAPRAQTRLPGRTIGEAFLFLNLLFAAAAGLAASVPAPYEIGTWRGFRPAAVSFTFDDGCSNQFAVAIPMFDQKGFKLTLFTPISTMFPGWPKLQSAAAKGHEIASHTMTHVNLGGMADALQVAELKDSRDAINANIAGQKCLTLAYPFCVAGKDALTAQYYIGARTCSGQIVSSTPANFMNISSFVCGAQGAVQTVQDFNSRANSAVTGKGWCVYLIHGIDNDGGYSPVSTATLQGSVNYLSANPDKFWVETFGNVVRYILERNAAVVTEVSTGDDSITLRLTDNLDNSVYNYPVTLRRPLPADWPGAAVSQNNQRLAVQIVSTNSQKYVMFDAVPDGGDVVLSKQAVPVSFRSPVRVAPGTFTCQVEGQVGARYAIHASNDLVSWTPVQTNTQVEPSTTVTVSAPNPFQFYRAQLTP